MEDTLDGGPGVPDGLWRVVSISHEVTDEFSDVWTRSTWGLEDERDDVDVWISVEFALLSSLGHVSWSGAGCSNKGRVSGERSNNGNIQVRGRTVDVEDKIHTRMLSLSVHVAGKSRHLLFKEYLGATV